MPHFLAIAVMYNGDYQLGGFKMLPCVDEALTARQMVIYSLALLPMSLMPVGLAMAGAVYFTAAVLLGLCVSIVRRFLCRDMRCARCGELFLRVDYLLPLLLAVMMLDRL